MSEASALRVVVSNCSESESAGLARTLVEERLAACVNILPIESIYRWQGEVVREGEHTLLIKTVEPRLGALLERLEALHSYSVPEIVVLEPEQAAAAYVAWAQEVTTP